MRATTGLSNFMIPDRVYTVGEEIAIKKERYVVSRILDSGKIVLTWVGLVISKQAQ